jgi:hypothetical protein
MNRQAMFVTGVPRDGINPAVLLFRNRFSLGSYATLRIVKPLSLGFLKGNR